MFNYHLKGITICVQFEFMFHNHGTYGIYSQNKLENYKGFISNYFLILYTISHYFRTIYPLLFFKKRIQFKKQCAKLHA